MEAKSDRYYQAVSRVRRKISEELPEDVALLEEHHPELFEELQEVVCEEEGESKSRFVSVVSSYPLQ